MSCSKRILGMPWKSHDWERQVTRTESFVEPGSDMWGRYVEGGHIVCHVRRVCRACGTIDDERECSCQPERAGKCAIRLQWIARQQAAQPVSHDGAR
jgi:hypothetical protein